jgi:hypothetical protein
MDILQELANQTILNRFVLHGAIKDNVVSVVGLPKILPTTTVKAIKEALNLELKKAKRTNAKATYYAAYVVVEQNEVVVKDFVLNEVGQ